MTPPYQKPTGRPTVTSSMSDAEITEVRAIIRKFQEAGLISTRPGIADEYIDAVQRKVKYRPHEQKAEDGDRPDVAPVPRHAL